MAKIITPTQYEKGAEGLNVLRPLSMGDKVKTDIAYPVGCSQETGQGKPFAGKLLAGTPSGALLENEPVFAKSFEYLYPVVQESVPNITLSFSQRVSGLLIWINPSAGGYSYYLTDDTFAIHIYTLSVTDYIYVPFVGDVFYISSVGVGFLYTACNCYGFYN